MAEEIVQVPVVAINGLEVLAPYPGSKVSPTFWVDGSYDGAGDVSAICKKTSDNSALTGAVSVTPHKHAWSISLDATAKVPAGTSVAATLHVTVLGGTDSSVTVTIHAPIAGPGGEDGPVGPIEEQEFVDDEDEEFTR